MELRKDTKERYLSYIFLWKSGKQHNKFKVDLQNDVTTGYERYSKKIQGTLMLLDKYTKSSVSQQTTSEGTPFSERGGASNKQLPPYDKKYWENMKCLRCFNKDHPASHFTKEIQ